MNAYQTCASGDCDPYSCPVCLNTCDGCGKYYDRCTCPQLPIDEEDDK